MLPDCPSTETSAREQWPPDAHNDDPALPQHVTRVVAGTSMTIEGVHRGTVQVSSGATALVRGTLEGAIFVSSKAS
ncbi:hypothetical protein AXA44_01310 [Rhodococcus sp. SC4]|nr:hypothetical protein AXA44_01310 [Rhodococcus sp. SC4]